MKILLFAHDVIGVWAAQLKLVSVPAILVGVAIGYMVRRWIACLVVSYAAALGLISIAPLIRHPPERERTDGLVCRPGVTCHPGIDVAGLFRRALDPDAAGEAAGQLVKGPSGQCTHPAMDIGVRPAEIGHARRSPRAEESLTRIKSARCPAQQRQQS
jgi:hypothetical protein